VNVSSCRETPTNWTVIASISARNPTSSTSHLPLRECVPGAFCLLFGRRLETSIYYYPHTRISLPMLQQAHYALIVRYRRAHVPHVVPMRASRRIYASANRLAVSDIGCFSDVMVRCTVVFATSKRACPFAPFATAELPGPTGLS